MKHSTTIKSQPQPSPAMKLGVTAAAIAVMGCFAASASLSAQDNAAPAAHVASEIVTD